MRRIPAVLVVSILAANEVRGAEIVLSQGLNGYSGAADATMFQELANNAGGASTGFFAGNTRFDAARRALLRFDLSTIPDGADVTAARLELVVVQGKGGDQTMTLHRVLEVWNEGTTAATGAGGQGAASAAGDTTWLATSHPSRLWSLPGGNFELDASATGIAGDNAGVVTVMEGAGLLADIRGFLAAPEQNFGWVLLGNEAEGETAKKFHSKESTTAASRPRLVLTVADSAPAAATGWMMF